MTIRKRLERLEDRQGHSGWDDRPPVILSLNYTTDDDVIGMSTGCGPGRVMRLPGEAYDDLVTRARPMLATPWAGMPLIMMCVYSDEARARVKEQTA